MRPGAARTLGTALALLVALALAGAVFDVSPPGRGTLIGLAAVLVVGGGALNVAAIGVPPSAPSTLYWGALAAFHVGLLVPWALGWVDGPVWLEAAPEPVLARALVAVIVAFAALEL